MDLGKNQGEMSNSIDEQARAASEEEHIKARRNVDKLMERKRLRDELGSVFDEDSLDDD